MALAFDAVAFDKATTATNLTFSHTCTGVSLVLYVIVGERFASAITGVTYNGVAMTQISYNDPGTNLVVQKVFRLIAPATGAHNIVVTLTTTRNIAATSISFSGADQVTPNGAVVNSNNGTGTSTAISDAVSSASGQIVVDAATIMENTAGTAALTVGGGQTQRSNQEQVSANGLVSATSTEGGAASVTMSWTASTASTFVHSAFAVSATGADTTPPGNPTVTAQESPLGTAISLTLTMPADGDTANYEIRRLTSDFPANNRSNGTVIVTSTATTPSATVNYTDTGLTNGTRYYYRVFVQDTGGNWNTGATISEVAATAMTAIGWYTSSGTFQSDGETGANPIFEWTVSSANVEAAKPVPFRFIVGSNNPGPNQAPTLDVQEFTSVDPSTFTAGSFKYFSGGSWVTMPVLGVPWAAVNSGTVTCRFYSQLNANQNLYGVVRPEQA